MQIQDVDRMAENGDLEGLVRSLQEENADVRRRAAVQLGFLADGRAVEPLGRVAEADPDTGVREAAQTAHERLIQVIQASKAASESYVCRE